MTTIKSTCNPKSIYNINGILCANGMHPDDQKCFLTKSGKMRQRPIVGKHERERIVALLKAGYTNQKVCEMTCRSTYTIHKIKKEAGLTKPRKQFKKFEEAIIVMYQHGILPTEIAYVLNLKPVEVLYVINRLA